MTTDPALYRLLVPNAPLHRRTDRDRRPAAEMTPRARAGALLRGKAAAPGLQRPSLVSSFRDRIDTILFAFPNYGLSDAALAEAYQSVVRALRVGTRFVVVHHKSGGRQVRKWFDSAGHPVANVTFVPLPDYVNFTDWAEDAYVALTDGSESRTYLMEPWEFPRAGDALIAEAIQEFTDIEAAQAPLIFQGGNCLVGDEFWLMGKDYFADSLSLVASDRAPVEKPDRKTPAAFLRRLFKDYVDFDRKLIVLGTAREIPVREFYGTREGRQFFLDLASGGAGLFQPIFHIDMFVTLVGWNARREFQVLVGSPAMADDMLGTTSPFALDDVYDALAKALTREGFEVTRNPLVHRPAVAQTTTLERLRHLATTTTNEAMFDALKELETLGARDSTKVIVRDWHHVTWNNCLVENTETVGRHVYLPTFGHGRSSDLKPIDAHMKKLWTSLGFTVHPLADFNEFARRQGVVHCIKKYLRRNP